MSNKQESFSEGRTGFTLVEIVIALGVFMLVLIVVFGFNRYYFNAVSITGWRQTAHQALKLNAIFWQDHFVAATHRITHIETDSSGVIVGSVLFNKAGLNIRSRGAGNLLDGYPGDGSRFELWNFEISKRDEAAGLFEGNRVSAFVQGTGLNINLWGQIASGGVVLREIKLLENVAQVRGTVRRYEAENANALKLDFVLQHPQRPAIREEGSVEVRVNTEIVGF